MTLQSHFGHFNMGILTITFFYGGVGREYEGGGRICPLSFFYKSKLYVSGLLPASFISQAYVI